MLLIVLSFPFKWWLYWLVVKMLTEALEQCTVLWMPSLPQLLNLEVWPQHRLNFFIAELILLHPSLSSDQNQPAWILSPQYLWLLKMRGCWYCKTSPPGGMNNFNSGVWTSTAVWQLLQLKISSWLLLQKMEFLSRLRKMLFYSLEKLERMYSPWIISIQSRPLKHLQYALAALTPRLLVNDCCHRQVGFLIETLFNALRCLSFVYKI